MRPDLYQGGTPEGWYAVGISRDLRRGEATASELGGAPVVVWRDAAGEVAAMDRYCSHRGADLSHGKAEGDALECPYHRWRFARDGRCVAGAGDGARMPARAHLRSYPVVERAGLLLACTQPDVGYTPPVLPGVEAARFHRPLVRRYTHDCHPLVILEDNMDVLHMEYVHGLQCHDMKLEIVEDTDDCFRFLTTYELDLLGRRRRAATETAIYGGTLAYGGSRVEGILSALFVGSPAPRNEGGVDFYFSTCIEKARGAWAGIHPLVANLASRMIHHGSAVFDGRIWSPQRPELGRVGMGGEEVNSAFHRHYARQMERSALAAPAARPSASGSPRGVAPIRLDAPPASSYA